MDETKLGLAEFLHEQAKKKLHTTTIVGTKIPLFQKPHCCICNKKLWLRYSWCMLTIIRTGGKLLSVERLHLCRKCMKVVVSTGVAQIQQAQRVLGSDCIQ